jgi:Ca2+-transporting ATPase
MPQADKAFFSAKDQTNLKGHQSPEKNAATGSFASSNLTHTIKNLHIKPYSKDLKELYSLLASDSTGLSQNQAASRLAQFGPNQLQKSPGISLTHLLWDQFNSLLVLILLIAVFLSFLMGEKLDGLAILAVVFLNSLLGFIQEFKAEKSLQELAAMERLKAIVLRDGKELQIDASQIVPGDILLLREGDKITADARLIEADSFKVDESILTGESESSLKQTEPISAKTGLADRSNMVFSGCLVTHGKARALVIRTGMKTQIGQIAHEITQMESEETPLQKALNQVSKNLAIVALAVSIPALALGIFMNRDAAQMFIMAISLAVSAIPEGLPIVITIALALGIKRMAKNNVLVRKLATAESLGGTDVICTDKTGTITHNQMTVSKVYLPEWGMLKISGSGFNLEGEVEFDKAANQDLNLTALQSGAQQNKSQDSNLFSQASIALDHLAQQAVLSSDATLEVGDPTERALLVLAYKLGLDFKELKNKHPRQKEIPFNSANKFMAVVVKNHKDDGQTAVIKGAPEAVMAKCSLDQEQRQIIHRVNNYLTKKSLRVLAIAEHDLPKQKKLNGFNQYHFLGLVAMYDPPRKEVKAALNVCHKAGIRVIMITGDHKNTAEAIAEQIGLDSIGAYSGEELDQMDEAYFKKVVKESNIFARVSPRHKVKILETLQAFGHQVAMTGDGVNDAPAIKKADVGIAVGSGTDLTKSVSDLILLDNNFASIAKGIKEGRRIFFNIKKFVRYMLSANFDEIAQILTSILLRLPLSLFPIHVLWLNLVTDSLPALALTVDEADEDIMTKPPYVPQKEILKGIMSYSLVGAVIGYAAVFSLFLFLLKYTGDIIYTRTMSFTSMVIFELFLVFTLRSESPGNFKQFFSNVWLWLSIMVAFVVQILAIYSPVLQPIFKTVPLLQDDWLIIFCVSMFGLVGMEIFKHVQQLWQKT